ncbi:MAG TPA: hypothetical protein DIU15_06175 [Deltaproteobacteria bacterium]|nr:hypothetical protein [Deltaproteobacteria bacterium]HCP45606.1 hypothetical protein [Deltaproteobacteria bacterium]
MSAHTSTPLPVVLVGAGTRARQIYGPLLTGPMATQLKLVAIASRSEDRARSLAEELGVPWSLSLEEAATDYGARGAIACVSSPDNHTVAHRILDLELPALLETPLALELGDARQLAQRIAQSDVPVEVAEQNPRFPREAFWRRIIEEGFLGEPRLLTSNRAGYRYHATAVARGLLGRPRGQRAVGMRAVFPLDLGRGQQVSTVHAGTITTDSNAVFQLTDGEGLHVPASPWLRGGWSVLCDGGSLVEPDRVQVHSSGVNKHLPVERVTRSIDGVEVTQTYRLHGSLLLESPSALPDAPLDDDAQAVARCLQDWLARIDGKPTSTGWSAQDGFDDLAWITSLERSALLGGTALRIDALETEPQGS